MNIIAPVFANNAPITPTIEAAAGAAMEAEAGGRKKPITSAGNISGRKNIIDKEEVYKLHLDGVKTKEIAKSMGVSVQAVNSAIRRRKGKKKVIGSWIDQNLTYETAGRKRCPRNEAIWAMHLEGAETSIIAEKFDCTKAHVRDVIRRRRKSARSKETS